MFGLSPLIVYALASAAIFASGLALGVRWESGQNAIKENARIELVREQERANRATERTQATNVITAQNEARKRESRAIADASGARTELQRLRGAIAVSPEPSDASASSCVERADPSRELLGECAAALADLGAKADRHASDAMTLLQAWPK